MAPLIGAPRPSVAPRSAGRTRLVTRRVTTISSGRRTGTAQSSEPTLNSKPPMSPPQCESQRTIHPSPRPLGARVSEPQEPACATQDSISWVKFGSVVSHVSFLKTPPETLAHSPKEVSSPGSIDWSGQHMDTVRRSVGQVSPRKDIPQVGSPEGPQLSSRLFAPHPQPMNRSVNEPIDGSPDSGRSPTSPDSSSPSSSPNWSDAEFSDSTTSSDVLTPAPSMSTQIPEQVAIRGPGRVVYIPRLELPTQPQGPVSGRSSSREVQEQLGQDFLSLSHSFSEATSPSSEGTPQGTWDENLLREINTALANTSNTLDTKSLDLWEQTPPSGCPGTPPSGDLNSSNNFSLRFELPVFELLPPPAAVTPGRQVRFASPGRQPAPATNPNQPAPTSYEPSAPAAPGLHPPSSPSAPTPIATPHERVGWGGPREMVLQTPPKPSPVPTSSPPAKGEAARPAPFAPKSPYAHLTSREAPQQGQRVNVPLVRQRVVYRNGVAVPQGQPLFKLGQGGVGSVPTSPLLNRAKPARFPAPAGQPGGIRANQHPAGCGCFTCVQDRYYALVRGIREQNHVTLERITAFANQFNARQAAAACAAMNGVAENRGRWQCTGCMLTVDESEFESSEDIQEGEEVMATWALELEWQDRTGTPEDEKEGVEASEHPTPIDTNETDTNESTKEFGCEEEVEDGMGAQAPPTSSRRNALGAQSRSRRGC